MKFKPLHDNVFVERDKADEKKTASGILLPKVSNKAPDTAVVIDVGPGRTLDDGTVVIPGVSAGDRVLIGRHSGVNAHYGIEEEVLVVPWGDILGVVDRESESE